MAFNASRLISTPQGSPKGSPYNLKPPGPRASPTRTNRNEQLLTLKQVIGTTATSNNGFDSIQDGNVFAFIAGSGAVLASVNTDNQVSQRFFRARPSVAPLVATPSVHDSPTPAAPSQVVRARTAASLREAGLGSPSVSSQLNDYNDSPSSKSAARAKASSCVALSADRRYMAVGETGHKPRVLIFSTAKDAPTDIPLAAMSEHTFGVRCLAFSPDSQYLASLGDMNDGFLYIWSINQRNGSVNLHATNKCTSNIRQIAWMGNTLITIGTRHVKVWRIEEATSVASARTSPSKRMSDMSFAFASPSASKALSGRNCLLGSLLDKIFTSVTVISPTKAVVGSEQGDICLLDDSVSPPQFTRIATLDYSVTALAFKPLKGIIIAGLQGQLQTLDLGDNKSLISSPGRLQLSDVELPNLESGTYCGILGLATLLDRLLLIDDRRSLIILEQTSPNSGHESYVTAHRFCAHGSAVLGIQAFPTVETDQSSFVTWSSDGTVLFWTSTGTCSGQLQIDLGISNPIEEYANELKVVRAFGKGQLLATGDRFGILRIIQLPKGQCLFDTRAHSNEITDIAIRDKGDAVILATAARDRIVQVFRWKNETCEHVQTVEEHTGAVTGLKFSADSNKLLSCSSDRSILIMDAVLSENDDKTLVGFLPSRPLILKAAPVSLDITADGILLVSTVDRSVHRYELSTGNLLASFKASDQENGDAVVLNSIVHFSTRKYSTLIAAVSGTDKSIRVYDEAGKLLEREFGHTEGMTGIARVGDPLKAGPSTIATVATDGTVFVWELHSAEDQLCDSLASMDIGGESPRLSQLFSNRPPLRKVLSSSELSRLHSLREESGNDSQRNTRSISPPAVDKPALKRRPSKLSMVQTPKLDPTVGTSDRRTSLAPLDMSAPDKARSSRRMSTMGPPSPDNPSRFSQTVRAASRSPNPLSKSRRKSFSTTNSFDEWSQPLSISTESICRSLHTFRKKLMQSEDVIPIDNAKELEKELSLTAKVLAEKSRRKETAVARLLDQYSEKFMELLEGRIEKSVERKMRVKERSPPADEDCPGSFSNSILSKHVATRLVSSEYQE